MELDVADAKPISPLMRRCRQILISTSRVVVLTHNGASVKDARRNLDMVSLVRSPVAGGGGVPPPLLPPTVAEFAFVDILCYFYIIWSR